MSENTPHIEPTLSATGSLAGDYFDRLYAARRDPWEFETNPYEAAKYQATLAALPRPHYDSALELGCSIGVLTQQLAARCARLLAVDISETALAQARARCRDLSQVRFEQRDVAIDFPPGQFDLILLSEIAYYFSLTDLEIFRARVAKSLTPGGHLLLVHFTGVTNYPLTADTVHEFFLAFSGANWRPVLQEQSKDYRLDLLETKT